LIYTTTPKHPENSALCIYKKYIKNIIYSVGINKKISSGWAKPNPIILRDRWGNYGEVLIK